MVPKHMAKTKAKSKGTRRRGRPPSTPEKTRRNRVVTLMTDAEFENLTKVADQDEKSVSAMVHEIVSRYLKRRSGR